MIADWVRGVVSMLTVVTESFLRWARESIVTLEEMAQGRRVGRIDFLFDRYRGDQKRKHAPRAKARCC